MKKIIGFDVDGTLTIGKPQGVIPIEHLHELKNHGGFVVGIISNRVNNKKMRPLMSGLDFYYRGAGKEKAQAMKKAEKLFGRGFRIKVYVGNEKGDRLACEIANWRFIHAREFFYLFPMSKGRMVLDENRCPACGEELKESIVEVRSSEEHKGLAAFFPHVDEHKICPNLCYIEHSTILLEEGEDK